MSAIETDIQWYIARDGKQHGPISDLELKKLVELSHLKGTDLVWRQGFSDWRTAASVFPNIDEPQSSAAPAASPATSTSASPSPSPAASSSSPSPSSTSTTAGSQPSLQPATGPSPSTQSYSPQTASPLGGFGSDRRGPGELRGDFRPEQLTARTAATPLRTEGPFTGAASAAPGPRITTTDSRKPSEMAVTPRPQQAASGGGGRKKALVILGLLAMTGTGAWISSQHKEEILEFLASQNGGVVDGEVTIANAVPPAAPPANAPATAPAPQAAITTDDIDRKLQGRMTWVSIKQEFPDWYQTRVAEVARLSSEKKEQGEINRYLINEFVQLRRENAKYALAASTSRHKEVAAAFLANLKQLSQESGEGCYDFISRGEISPSIVTRLEDPAKSADIEAQMVAVVAAISEGRKTPNEHTPPVKTDYDVLAGELGRLGWTQADMQLFANPKELAKAPRERVCSMLKDWFTAHLSIQDPSTQERLLFETLKPVVSG
jgi:hypothetical protein